MLCPRPFCWSARFVAGTTNIKGHYSWGWYRGFILSCWSVSHRVGVGVGILHPSYSTPPTYLRPVDHPHPPLMSSRFFGAYYISHVFLISLYFGIRPYLTMPRFMTTIDSWGLTRETETYIFTCVVLMMRYRKSASIDSFLSKIFLYWKATILGLLALVDGKLAFWFAILTAIVSFQFEQDMYDARGEGLTYFDDPLSLSAALSSQAVTWLVAYYTTWSPDSVHIAPVWSELHYKYDNGRTVRLGKMDIGRWPSVAKDCDIGTAAGTDDLPTIILYENGVEKKRIQGPSKMVLSAKNIADYFGLRALKAGPTREG